MVDPDPEIPAGVVTWVRSRHAAGATLVSLCSGAFILAETGLVDGLSVAAPPICATALANRFPKVVVDTGEGQEEGDADDAHPCARERRGEQKADPERDRNRPYGVGARGTDKDRNARPEIARRAAPRDLGGMRRAHEVRRRRSP